MEHLALKLCPLLCTHLKPQSAVRERPEACVKTSTSHRANVTIMNSEPAKGDIRASLSERFKVMPTQLEIPLHANTHRRGIGLVCEIIQPQSHKRMLSDNA